MCRAQITCRTEEERMPRQSSFNRTTNIDLQPTSNKSLASWLPPFELVDHMASRESPGLPRRQLTSLIVPIVAFLLSPAINHSPNTSTCLFRLFSRLYFLCVTPLIYTIYYAFLLIPNLEQHVTTLALTLSTFSKCFTIELLCIRVARLNLFCLKILDQVLRPAAYFSIISLSIQPIWFIIHSSYSIFLSLNFSSPPAPPTPPSLSEYICYTLCAIISLASFAVPLYKWLSLLTLGSVDS